ncbi:MAG: GIY-YIG nuclease family protein [Verrucomicrobia bacterium]|nr:GIY-YIG nuclease family protein [Verrucomicrobiota bacterium]
MNKQQILDEIRRTAKANGGKPLGRATFAKETGVRTSDWYAKHWTAWGDALKEAGFAPNELQSAFDDDYLIRHLIALMRELQPPRFPVAGDLRIKARNSPGFPSHTAFERLGNKAQRAAKVAEYCAANGGMDDIILLCQAVQTTGEPLSTPASTEAAIGYVYLIKHGSHREYKIGRTNNRLRREGEIGIELPQKIEPIHVIASDDPSGVEAYWHRRFAEKRLKHEWFALTPDDVRAFKRWKRII